ncbi:RNA polymerase sigma factor [Euzebya tangerina]|uniref:RNA polymerase sigma factor n=1 Tax=Euzebya tangerina TaxID=591198 RepID=UPI0013C2BD3A|nr:RNA polymerase sigma factor [Euzebya tangerina]
MSAGQRAGEGGEDLNDLAVRARSGDTQALDRLLERIDADGLVRVPVRRIITDRTTVEDVCQDLLIIVAERIDRWDGRSRFTTWLYAVARNRAIDTIRRNRPTEQLPAELPREQQRVSSLIADRLRVDEALADLPDNYRQPVVLRDVDQHDYDEIAAMLDLHPATVRTRVSRGRAMVAARWRREG